MKKIVIGQKRPLYLISGILLAGFGVARYFFEEPDYLIGGLWIALGFANVLYSGYLYAHRRIVLEKDQITLFNINKEHKRVIEHSSILRAWENKTHFIIDLAEETIEIDKAIFNKPQIVSKALASLNLQS